MQQSDRLGHTFESRDRNIDKSDARLYESLSLLSLLAFADGVDLTARPIIY